jgi:xanthine dehydrogenase YagS FAD-binding subunit
LLQRPRCWYFRHPDLVCFKKGGSSCPAVGGPEHAHPGALFPGVCHAGHPSDLAPALIALDAAAQITSPDGTRTLPLQTLYADAASSAECEAALRRDEVLTALVMPASGPAQAFEKLAPRDANEFAWAGVAVVIEPSGDVIGRVRIAASGIAPGPWLFDGASALLMGQRPADVDVAHVARSLLPASQRASILAAREATARVAIERALARALQRWPTATHNAR